jgi:DNA-binding MarR family transcriptional regulator
MLIDPLKGYPGYALRRASHLAMSRLTKKLAALELRPVEATVLLLIDANPGITQSDIGRALEIASSNMANLISRLDARDLIEREPVDGRSHGLNLSRGGKALSIRIRKIVDTHENALMEKIPAAQRAAFISALHLLWDD